MIARLNSLKVPRLKLYQQIIAWFVLVVFLPLLGVSFIIYNINQKALKKELIKFTDHTAEAIYKDLETEMSWQQAQVNMLGSYLNDTYTLTHNLDRSIQGALQLSPQYEAVAVYDAEGNSLKAAYRNFTHLSPELRLPLKLSHKALASATARHMDYSVMYANTGDPKDNTYYLRGILPIKHPQFAFYAIQIRFNYLQELIRDNSKSLHTSVYIVDNSGGILAGPQTALSGNLRISPEDYRFFKTIPDGVTREFSTTAQTAPNGDSPAQTNDDNDDPPTLQKIFVKMPDIGWGIILESPYNVRQTYVKRARDQSLLLIVACLVLVSLLALFYILGINRNFRQLIKAIKAMAEGNYARKIRLITNTITPYEIVYLAGEFNRMGRKMSEAWRNSQTLNLELLRKNEEEAFLNRVTKHLHGTISLEEVCQLSIQSLGPYLHLGLCAVTLGPEPDWTRNRFWIWHNGQHPEISPEHLQAFPAPDQELLQAGHPLLLDPKSTDWLRAFELGEAFIQPIQYQSQTLGVLFLIRTMQEHLALDALDAYVSRGFSSEETHLVGLVANQVGVALHQAHQWLTIQEANNKLAKLDELKSNLIDTVSHELRTPLTSIKGYTSRLLRYDDSLTGEMRTKSLKVIKQQADRLSRLVEDLLVIPDLETNNLRVFPDQVFLPDVVERSVQFIQEKAMREIRIHFPSQELPAVLADPDRLEQILLNLLDNAVKYSIPDTVIDVTLEACEGTLENAWLRICVSNDSPMIPARELDGLFEKFKRLDDGLTRTTRGSGLGLFITRELMEAMGGNIRLLYDSGRFTADLTLPVYRESDLTTPIPTA